MQTHYKYFIGAAASIAIWIMLAFVWAIPKGWAHVPLALGATLVALGIVGLPPRNDTRP